MPGLDDLTPEERERLQALSAANPDATDARPQFKFGPDVEQTILACMLADRAFLVQANELIKPDYFPHLAREFICRVVQEHFEKYKDIPPRQVVHHELMEKVKNKGKPAYFWEAELNTIYDNYEPHLQIRDYLLDQIEEFAKVQAFKLAYKKSIDMVFGSDEGKWQKMADILKEPFLISRQRDLGLDYFQMLDERFARMKEKQATEVFTSGFPVLDIPLGGGIGRGEIAAWMGMPGTGKSVLLVKTAAANIVRGKKVLFLSLEMDADKIAKRFDAIFTRYNIQDLMVSKKEVINILRGIHKEDPDNRRLIIKQFAAGTADTATFRAYHSQLLQAEGFRPDLVIVDYVGEMRDYPGMKTWESRQRLCRDLRAWGIEEQHATYTALQPNRGGREQQEGGVIDDSFLADSFGQARVLDALWSINQSKKEKLALVCRINNIKMRDGKSGTQIYCKQNPQNLDFEHVEESDYRQFVSKVVEEAAANTTLNIDGQVGGRKKFKPNSDGGE